MPKPLQRSGSTEAIVLIKAAPQLSQKHGETVCCAGIDLHGRWLRLYPVSFRHLPQRQQFGRWDRIKFGWRLPPDDRRVESRRVDQDTIEIVGALPKGERERFLAKSLVTSLVREREAERSLALLRPEVIEFFAERKTPEELAQEARDLAAIRGQADLFASEVAPRHACPYRFKYRYRTDDGERTGTCQDWEVEATFFRRAGKLGEREALDSMHETFGIDYPRNGMALAMGTHSRYPDLWLINGIVRLDEVRQESLL